jgi:serine/threonine protein kinase
LPAGCERPACLDTVGPYRLVRYLGAGGMGSVFEAEDTRTGQLVALKRLHPHVAERASATQRFLREGRIAARVRHPHVVQIRSVGEHAGVPFLAMELLQGCDLAAILSRDGRLPVDRVLDLLLPVVSAVAAAHEAGVIHRDLKPSNVFVARTLYGLPWPKVVDFGVSKVVTGDDAVALTPTGGLFGTIAYMAPEQAHAAHDVSFSVDQYALGVVLYHCLTGHLPFSGRSVYQVLQAVMIAPVTPPSKCAPNVPQALDAIVLRAMRREPEARFASVRELEGALLSLCA